MRISKIASGQYWSGRSVRIGRVLWRLVDAPTDTSELLIDGERVVYGSIEVREEDG